MNTFVTLRYINIATKVIVSMAISTYKIIIKVIQPRLNLL